MIDSILTSIKKSLDIDEDYTAFDDVIEMHINTQFSTLFSIGACGPEPFMITGKDEKWSDYYGQINQAMMVKTWMFIRVKMLFDPPATSFAQQAMQAQADELQWRLGIMEFVFNPNSEPIDSPADNFRLQQLSEQIDEVEKDVDDIDEEIDEIPDLTAIFKLGVQEN